MLPLKNLDIYKLHCSETCGGIGWPSSSGPAFHEALWHGVCTLPWPWSWPAGPTRWRCLSHPYGLAGQRAGGPSKVPFSTEILSFHISFVQSFYCIFTVWYAQLWCSQLCSECLQSFHHVLWGDFNPSVKGGDMLKVCKAFSDKNGWHQRVFCPYKRPRSSWDP